MTPEEALRHIAKISVTQITFEHDPPLKIRHDDNALKDIIRIAKQGLKEEDGRVQAHEAERPGPGAGQ